jgi:excisionase family DNA binding protein
VSQEDPLFTPEQAAEYLGVSPRWLTRAVNERRFSHVKLGRQLRFKKSVLDRYIADNTREAQPKVTQPRVTSARRGSRSVRKAVA